MLNELPIKLEVRFKTVSTIVITMTLFQTDCLNTNFQFCKNDVFVTQAVEVHVGCGTSEHYI